MTDTYILQACFAVSAAVLSVRYLHMMQLASYQTNGYYRWLKDNSSKVAGQLLPALIAIFMTLWTMDFAVTLTAGLLLMPAVFMFPHRKKKAKKPLKFTPRAIRLFILQIMLICGLSFSVHLPFNTKYRIIFVCTLYLLLPFSIILSNIISLPVQKLINNGYIRDAKKRLAAHENLLIIGVTGSYGKTSVKQMLKKLLSVNFTVFATPESYNTPLGVVRAIREGLDATHEVFVCEMGARHVGDIKQVTDIVNPKLGIITSVGAQHLETFKTLDNIVKTKFELADALPLDGAVFLCSDFQPIRERSVNVQARYFGREQNEKSDLWAENIETNINGTQFTVRTRDGREQTFQTPLLGKHQVSNLLAAISVADYLGIPLQKLVPAVKSITPTPHRLQLIPGGHVNIIDDAYNSNPAGAAAALEVLSMFDGAKVLVTPGMVELGKRQDEENRLFGVKAAGVCDYVMLVGSRQTTSIAQGLKEAGFPQEKLFVYETFKAAIEKARTVEDSRDLYILLENDLPDNY